MSTTDRRTHIAKEILSTERTFVKNLRTIVDVFLLPLRLAIDDGKTIIKQRNIEEIFSNIEEIMRVSVQFLFLVEQRVEIWNDNPCIGDVFMEVIPEFGVYDKYLMDHHRAIMKVTELEKRGPFAQFLELALQRPECDNLDLLALLITPVQRILRYKMFLEDLMKCTPDTHTDQKNISLALAAVLEKAAAVNESIKAAENYEKLCQIQKSFITQSGNVKNLVSEDRLFIREGGLTKVCRKIPKKRWFFLFSDIVIYASSVTQSGVAGNLYSFHRMFQLSKTRVNPAADTETQKNAFHIITNDKSFTVFADTPEEKELWIQDFTKATASNSTAKQSINTAPIWVPDNNGVVCRICSAAFTWVSRRHHCRQCGNLICGNCSQGRSVLAHTADTKSVRVCDDCCAGAGVAASSISAPTFSHGSSQHAVVSQIMKDMANSTAAAGERAISRGPSKSGLKPPSTPLPPTPLQASGQLSTSPVSPNGIKTTATATTTKPVPPLPGGAASLKRANTVGVVNHSADSNPPVLPPKPAATTPRTLTIPPQPTGPAPMPSDDAQRISPRVAQESASQGSGSEEQNLEAEVQTLLNNLQKMLKTESQTANLPLIERVRFFSSKINEHNQKCNTPPSGPPPSPPSTHVNPPFATPANAKPKPSATTPNGIHAKNPALRTQHSSANDLTDTSAALAAQVASRPNSTPSSTSSPATNGNTTTPPARPPSSIIRPNNAPSLPVVPPRKAANIKQNPARASALSSTAAPILVDSSRT